MNADTVYKRGGASGFPVLPPPTAAAPMPPMTRPLFPLRFGYTRTQPGIMDVLNTTRLYPDARSATSGIGEPGYSGTARPANSWW